ncbi:hypothetical protein ACIQMR_35370 [Streptomyces sp. NPDC091376]|uniref:hypothetical protein n=1 Tax=Streptomyces sp. NPDC091376 TaxID=3365994 RepID=UPI003821B001
MAKYTIPLNGYASATLTIETDETDPELILEEALNQGVPGICAQCSGWGRPFSIELGDEWEETRKPDGTPEIYEGA